MSKRKSNTVASKPPEQPQRSGQLSPQAIQQIAAQVAPLVARALTSQQGRQAMPPQRMPAQHPGAAARPGLPPNIAALLAATQNTGRRSEGDPRQQFIDQLALAHREASLKVQRENTLLAQREAAQMGDRKLGG